MNDEERKAELKSLIEEYEICFEESKYEGNIEEYKSLKETHKLLKYILNLIEKQNSIIKNAIDYIQHNNKELKNYSEQEMLDWLYGLDKCCEIKEEN